MRIQPAPGIRGWLDPNGTCYHIKDTHTDFSANYLKIKLPPMGTPEFLKAGLEADNRLYNRGWARIIIKPETRILYFDTLNKPWKTLDRRQRGWLYDVATNGIKIEGGKILPGDEVLPEPLNITFGDTNKNPKPEELIAESTSFFGMLKEMLLERMSFKDLYNASDPARISRASHVRPRPLRVASMNKKETWTFRYKSSPSTTGNPWHGYIQFFKDSAVNEKNAGDVDCIVDCDCPDYRYKWAYVNTQLDASRIGRRSWNQCKNRPPKKTNPNMEPGLCKHLLSLSEYLKTKLDPEAPEPGEDEYDPYRVKPKVKREPVPPSTARSTVKAPEPDDGYSDSRTGSDTLQEDIMAGRGGGSIYDRIEKFVGENPEFDVMYDDAPSDNLNEDYHHLHKEYRLYEGNTHITAIFEDGSKLAFEVHYHDNHGEDREKWRHKAFTKWKSLASKIHNDIELNEVGNPIEMSWKTAFAEALKDPELQEYIRQKHHVRVFDDKGYPASVQGKPQACIDPVNFTRMG